MDTSNILIYCSNTNLNGSTSSFNVLNSPKEFSKLKNDFKDKIFSDDIWLLPAHNSTTEHKLISPECYNSLSESETKNHKIEKSLLLKDLRLPSSEHTHLVKHPAIKTEAILIMEVGHF